MLSIKDFKKDDKAYMLTMYMGRNTQPSINEVTVTSVGRTYVTIKTRTWTRRFMTCNKKYLHEKTTYGESSMLFKTKEDAENHIEKCDLALWLGTLSTTKAEKYSLEQLRQVKAVLTN